MEDSQVWKASPATGVFKSTAQIPYLTKPTPQLNYRLVKVESYQVAVLPWITVQMEILSDIVRSCTSYIIQQWRNHSKFVEIR